MISLQFQVDGLAGGRWFYQVSGFNITEESAHLKSLTVLANGEPLIRIPFQMDGELRYVSESGNCRRCDHRRTHSITHWIRKRLHGLRTLFLSEFDPKQ